MMTAPNDRAAGELQLRATAQDCTSKQTKLDRSTSTAAQEARLVAALRVGPRSTDELRALGIYQPGARVWYLRARGYVILTELFDGYAADGYSHARMARYTLVSEPDGEQLALPLRRPRQRPGGASEAAQGVR